MLKFLFFSSRRLFSLKSSSRITENISQGRYDIGNYAEIWHSFTQEDVNVFATLSGDNNPIHLDPNYAINSTRFHGTICHGILVSSLFSMLFGKLIPGSIYLKQNLNFLKPVYVNDSIVARVTIQQVENKRIGLILNCQTTVQLQDGKKAIDGEASVLIPIPKSLSS